MNVHDVVIRRLGPWTMITALIQLTLVNFSGRGASAHNSSATRDPGEIGYRESKPLHPSLADYPHCLLTVHISAFLHQSIAKSTDCPCFLKDGSAGLFAPYPEGFLPLS